MPSLGADMDSGTLVEWLVKPGDVVHRGDIMAVVDTTKSAIEVEVFTDGEVSALLVEPGTTVPVGTPLARLVPLVPLAAGASGPAAGRMAAEAGAEAEAEAGAGAGTVAAAAGATPVVASPLVRHLAHERGVDLGQLTGTGPGGAITRADVDAASAVQAAPAVAAASRGPEPPAEAGLVPSAPTRARLSPLARRRAAELGLDPDGLHGTGPGGAITAGDVERAAQERAAAAREAVLSPAPSPAAPRAAHRPRRRAGAARAASEVSVTEAGTEGGAPPSEAPARPSEPSARPSEPSAAQRAAARSAAMRQTIASLMARSKREIPHYYLQETVDLAATDAFVRRHNAQVELPERILPAVALLKAAALAVHAVPELNGFVVDGEFRRSDHVHLGVAVSLRGGGLVAPAIHDADTLPLPELMARLKDLVARTRAGRLRGSEMSDPTITVTNLGDQGSELVHGVIYPPQVALVGFGRVVQRPWAVDGMLTVRPLVTVTLAADHRVSDGHRGGRYLAAVADLLQRPEEL